MQVYDASCPAKTTNLQRWLSVCVDGVASWMSSNHLQLNAVKTELLWCGSLHRIAQLPSDQAMFCSSSIRSASSVRDLGVCIDSGVTMSMHISKVIAGCFAILCQLHSIRRSLMQATLTGLLVSLVWPVSTIATQSCLVYHRHHSTDFKHIITDCTSHPLFNDWASLSPLHALGMLFCTQWHLHRFCLLLDDF